MNTVLVINIYGTTKHEQPQYSIASTSLERYPSQPASELLCEPIPIRPQFQAIDNPKDGLVPKIIYQKIAPIYIFLPLLRQELWHCYHYYLKLYTMV
ncbi:MAG: hypothetical protein JNN25_08375 [Candidatus Kapabacteria bacterium]|nr:hypothetical protein [Candidatus Kapabacteria bacterium]